MRLRKAEREQLVALLDEEWASVDDLAAAVFDQAAGLLLARDWWTVAHVTRDALMLFGPYGTRGQAEKALPSLEFLADGSRVFIRKLAVVGTLEEVADVA